MVNCHQKNAKTRDRLMRVQFFIGVLAAWTIAANANAAPGTAPPPGLRETSQRVHAIVGAKIIVSPDKTIDNGTLVLRDGVIVAVGDKVALPADAQVWNAAGKIIYPGLIDAFSELAAKGSRPDAGGAGYWNGHVVPQMQTHLLYASDAGLN